ncbi:MAG: hypothetical protein JXE07_03785 [Candidatus Aminicenantes bacterium]|nr:hypothetical protein [Candidatus Aminicenantes bacterium]
MEFYFIRDYRQKYRFFSSEPQKDFTIPVSRTKRAWELAREKLTLLPPRILRQEQALIRILKIDDNTIAIRHSGGRSEKRIGLSFFFFLQKQRSKHILLLVVETLLLPLSGLAALLPGPNVAFAALALMMITHWQALRGINGLARKKHEFTAEPGLAAWEEAVDLSQEERYPDILREMETEFALSGLRKILWK